MTARDAPRLARLTPTTRNPMTTTRSITRRPGRTVPAGPPAATARHRRAPTRMFHWLFALSFLGAYVTADGERWRALHVTLGYTLAGLLAFRLLYGLFGPRPAAWACCGAS
jgi:hypothetical protein